MPQSRNAEIWIGALDIWFAPLRVHLPRVFFTSREKLRCSLIHRQPFGRQADDDLSRILHVSEYGITPVIEHAGKSDPTWPQTLALSKAEGNIWIGRSCT
jgi:hypothetical protein